MTWYDKIVLTAFAIFFITGEWLFVMNLIKKKKYKHLREAALDDRLGFYLFLNIYCANNTCCHLHMD